MMNQPLPTDQTTEEKGLMVTGFTMRGTHLGEFAGVPPAGKQITLRGVHVQKIRSGRIVEQWGDSNSLQAFLALGAVQRAGKTGPDSGFSSLPEVQ